jgi:outer membrane protein
LTSDTLKSLNTQIAYSPSSAFLPELHAAQHRLRAAKHSSNIFRSQRYPSFSISTGVITRSSSLLALEQNKQFRRNVSEYVAFNLRVPIFNQFQVNNNIVRAKIEVDLRENELRQVEQKVEETLQNTVLDVAAAQKKYVALQKQVGALSQEYIFAEKSYQAGTMTFLEYNIANTRYSNSEVELLQAKYDFYLKRKILDFYENKSLLLE